MKILGFVVLLGSLGSLASATVNVVPEIDSGFAANAIGLIAGVALIVRSRARR